MIVTESFIDMYSIYSFEITSEVNMLLEDEMKVQIRIPIWPSQIPDLDKFLFGQYTVFRLLNQTESPIFVFVCYLFPKAILFDSHI